MCCTKAVSYFSIHTPLGSIQNGFNFDIDFINFRFIFDTKLAWEKKFVQLHDMVQFKHVHFIEDARQKVQFERRPE